MNLHEYFDRVVLINLERRPDRRARVLHELQSIDWPFKQPQVFRAIDGLVDARRSGWPAGAWGCLRSHQMILEQAIADGTSSLLVLEDDVCFAKDFRKRIEQFLLAVPDDWDQLMIGGRHMTALGWPTQVNSSVTRVFACEATHCYAIRGEFMRRLAKRWGDSCAQGRIMHCDTIMSSDPELQRAHKVYAPSEFLAGQERGSSDVAGVLRPKMFWNPPTPDLPVLLLKSSMAVAEELKEFGFFYGSESDSISAQLRKLGSHLVQDAHNADEIAKHLSPFLVELQWQVASEPRLLATIWHPGVTEDMLQAASLWDVVSIQGQTAQGILKQLPQDFRRPRIPLLADQAILHFTGPMDVLDTMSKYGWHSGRTRDSQPGNWKDCLATGKLRDEPDMRQRQICELVKLLQQGARYVINGIGVVCHDQVSLAELRRVSSTKIVEICSQSLQEAIHLWETAKFTLNEPPMYDRKYCRL